LRSGRVRPTFRCLAARPCSATLPERAQDACRQALAAEAREHVERENAIYLGRPKRHQPAQRSTAATSTRPAAVALASDDPLKKIEPRLYVEALTGELVPANGWMRCPARP
jgi:hypothetical protein